MEFLALFNEQGELLTSKVDRKEKLNLEEGLHFKIILAFIMNSDNKFLIQRVTKEKGDCFATTGGHVQFGISSIDTAKAEISEELGLSIEDNELELFKTYKCPKAFVDVYYLNKDIDIDKFKIQESELEYVLWMSINEIEKLIEEGQFRKANIEPFYDLIKSKNIVKK